MESHLVQKSTAIVSVKDPGEAPRLLLKRLYVLDLDDEYISRLCCFYFKRTTQVVYPRQIDVLHVICTVIILDLASSPVNAFYFYNFAILDRTNKRNWSPVRNRRLISSSDKLAIRMPSILPELLVDNTNCESIMADERGDLIAPPQASSNLPSMPYVFLRDPLWDTGGFSRCLVLEVRDCAEHSDEWSSKRCIGRWGADGRCMRRGPRQQWSTGKHAEPWRKKTRWAAAPNNLPDKAWSSRFSYQTALTRKLRNRAKGPRPTAG